MTRAISYVVFSLAVFGSAGAVTSERKDDVLQQLLRSAQAQAPSARIADAFEIQRRYDAQAAWFQLLPRLETSASYRRNDPVVDFELPAAPDKDSDVITFTPQNQLEASVQLEVPLLHWSAFARVLEAGNESDSARLFAVAERLKLERRVAAAYHAWIGADALAQANTRALRVAEEASVVVRARAEAGTVTTLERSRAEAEVERARARAADAEELRISAARRLTTLCATALPSTPTLDPDPLLPERPLDGWLADAKRLPGVAAAAAAAEAASARAVGVWATLAPNLSAVAAERLTNANGFGPVNTFYAGLQVRWALDASVASRALSAQAGVIAAQARTQAAVEDAREAIEEAWQRVHARSAKLIAARRVLAASQEAAGAAHERFEAGSLSLLDVVSADRDVLLADVELIQAELDVKQARVDLRIAAGQGLLDTAQQGGGA